jgi:hypothetical protein
MSVSRTVAVTTAAALLLGPLAPGGAVADLPAFTNPALGPDDAPVTLEYFAAVGCVACARFEAEQLPALLEAAAAGRVRIVFRDVPPSELAWAPWARRVFCQQEQDDYVDARERTKAAGPDAEPLPAPESAPARARRYRACLAVPPAVLEVNAWAMAASGLHGLPGFLLTERSGIRTTWSGYGPRGPELPPALRRPIAR